MKTIRRKLFFLIFLGFVTIWQLSRIQSMYQRESQIGCSNFPQVDAVVINDSFHGDTTKYNSVTFPTVDVDTTPLTTTAMASGWFADMSYLDMSMSACNNDNTDPYDVLILIKTDLANREARMELRKSWANNEYLSNLTMTIKYGFVVGNPDLGNGAPDLAESIRNESQTFQDIIAADFMDTYRNLTYKTMAGLGWGIKHCPHFRYYLSTDDDVCISLRNIQKFLQNPFNYSSSITSKNGDEDQLTNGLYAGYIKSATPERDEYNKYYVSYEEYPYDTIPRFAGGWFVLMSQNTVHTLYDISKSVSFVPLEDVYLGLMVNQTRILPFDLDDSVEFGTEVKIENLDFYRNYIATHNMTPLSARKKLCEYMANL